MQSPFGPYFIVKCSSCNRPQLYLSRKRDVKSRKKTCPFCGQSFTIHLERALAGFSSQKTARSFLLSLTDKERRNSTNFE